MDWLDFSIVIACLLVSAFFAASETALTGASRASMLRLSKQGNREAAVVSSLSSMRERLIGALLLGNNIANIGASALGGALIEAHIPIAAGETRKIMDQRTDATRAEATAIHD